MNSTGILSVFRSEFSILFSLWFVIYQSELKTTMQRYEKKAEGCPAKARSTLRYERLKVEGVRRRFVGKNQIEERDM